MRQVESGALGLQARKTIAAMAKVAKLLEMASCLLIGESLGAPLARIY